MFCYYVELKRIAVTYRLQFLNLFKLLTALRKCNTELINGEVGFQGASTRFTEHRPLREKKSEAEWDFEEIRVIVRMLMYHIDPV